MSILSVKNLTIQHGKNVVLKDINTDIERGDVVTIIGPSGSGKTALLRAIQCLDKSNTGDIFFMGEKITKKNINQIRRKIGMVFKEARLFSHLTLLENVALAPVKYMNFSREKSLTNAMLLLKSVGLAEKAHFYPHQVEEKHRLRVALARCAIMNPEIVLVDDSPGIMETIAVDSILAYVIKFTQIRPTIIMETNDVEFIRVASNRVFYLDEKSIYEEGAPEQIFDNPQRQKTKDFVSNLNSYSYEIYGKDFDFVELYIGLESFCIKNYVDINASAQLRLLIDELVTNIIIPIYHACSLKIVYSRDPNSFEIFVSYKDIKINVLEKSDDVISLKMIRKYAKSIKHIFEAGLNTIHVEM